jgi:hypothetical protein
MINFLNKERSPKGKCIKRPYLCSFLQHTNLRLLDHLYLLCSHSSSVSELARATILLLPLTYCYLVLLLNQEVNSLEACLIMWLHRAAWNNGHHAACCTLLLRCHRGLTLTCDSLLLLFLSLLFLFLHLLHLLILVHPSTCAPAIHLFPSLAPPTQSNKSVFGPPSPSTSFR